MVTIQALEAVKNIKVNTNLNTKEYRVMYLWGAWITKAVIYAENDTEAIHDAQEYAKDMKSWKEGVALWCGNRLVKEYVQRKTIHTMCI